MAHEVLVPFPQHSLLKTLDLAFEEDVREGDITSLGTIPENQTSQAQIIAKEDGVIAGLPLIEKVFNYRKQLGKYKPLVEEGARVKKGTAIYSIQTNTRELLQCERIILNLLQRTCGIATQAYDFQQCLKGSRTKILDTRKTIPGYRDLDKYAVKIGGAFNHRQGLYDQILIKDNHIVACGSVRLAVDKVFEKYGHQYLIEAEVLSLNELESLITSSVNRVLLDNMSYEQMKAATELIHKHSSKIKLEASGNMTLDRVKQLAPLNLDYISVGRLTHSVNAMDLSLKFKKEV